MYKYAGIYLILRAVMKAINTGDCTELMHDIIGGFVFLLLFILAFFVYAICQRD